MAELFVAQDLLKDFTEKTQTKYFAMSFRLFLLRGARLERAALSSLYALFVVSCEVLVLKPALICHVDAVGVPSFLPLKHQRLYFLQKSLRRCKPLPYLFEVRLTGVGFRHKWFLPPKLHPAKSLSHVAMLPNASHYALPSLSRAFSFCNGF